MARTTPPPPFTLTPVAGEPEARDVKGLKAQPGRPPVRVLVPLALPTLLDYSWGGTSRPQIGDWVEVPVGSKTVHGVVAELPGVSPFANLKVARPLPAVPGLAGTMVDFFRWAARYTLSAPGEPLRVALPRAHVPPQPVPDRGVQRTLVDGLGKLTAQRQKVLDAVGVGAWPPAELARAAGVSAGVVKGLVETGWLAEVALGAPDWQTGHGPILYGAQADAVAAVMRTVGGGKGLDDVPSSSVRKSTDFGVIQKGVFQTYLLDGVTGSGKTEVYFALIDEVLKSGGQALLLVPEIALTPQMIARVKARFGRAPAIWHSGAADGARAEAWWAAATGAPVLVVGARSGLFLPWKNLRLVVVDEEHDGSYKQDEAFRYNGRDLAIQLARQWGCPAVLGSATPSLETFQAALSGRYEHLKLPDRHGGAMMPRIELVDLKAEKLPKGDYIGPALARQMEATVARGEQVLLYLNRRGVAPVLLCATCGTRRDCPRCDATLVVHGDRLQCHHCGFNEERNDLCQTCGSEDLRLFGPGTRRVAAEVQRKFPQMRVLVADSDSVSTPKQLEEAMDAVQGGRVDVLVGTQLVTKGHHVPNLTLVGVVDGDLGLAHGDLRAAERTWQVLQQVAGRAGRGAKAGTVLIQTHSPEQPLFTTLVSGDRDGFYGGELKARQAWGDPPFGRQVAVIIDGLDQRAVTAGAQALARAFPAIEGHRLLGPAPAPLERRNEKWRWRLLVKAPRIDHAAVKAWLEGVALPKGVRAQVDVDPVTFL